MFEGCTPLLPFSGLAHFLRPLEQFRFNDSQLRALCFNFSVDQITGIALVPNHADDADIGNVFAVAAHDIVLTEVMAQALCSIAFINVFLEDQADNGRFMLVDFQIVHFLVTFIHPAMFYTAVAKSNNPACVVSFLSQLFHPGPGSDGGLDAFSRCLPVPDVVHQLVNMAVKPLLTFLGAPHLDALLDEPFHHKRRFIITAAQTVVSSEIRPIRSNMNTNRISNSPAMAAFWIC